ncbi:uncharacterized protein LOC117119513 [Anneissia japonica]|uniref:uncharacterized protein LOC117119513 n=1 Tax=Anneissia japonica TaxID=1529436 RepID=UPI00142589DD|nr:uncharacterized protein LOC117119513 [Anneissia japonica]
MPAPPPKKAKYACSFKPDFTKMYPCIIGVKSDSHAAKCTVCNLVFTVRHGGKNDVDKHIKGKKHEKCAKEIAQNQTFKFTSQSGSLKEKLIRAEVLFTAFILEHNLPFAQHANQLFKQMFPDSEVAKEYKCSYTKTAAITENSLEPEASKVMFSCLRDRRQPFTLMLDESNDILCQKECAILVRYFNEELGKVSVGFLDMPFAM